MLAPLSRSVTISTDSTSAAEIVDHRYKMDELGARLQACEARCQTARTRSIQIDQSVHAVRAGAERLVQMLGGIRTTAHAHTAPPTLTVRRGGSSGGGAGGSASADSGGERDSTFLTQAVAVAPTGGAAASGAAAGGERAAPAVMVTVALRPNTIAPPGSSAAGAILSSVDALQDLATLESRMRHAPTECADAAVAALHGLASAEHRLAVLLPELQLHEARMRLRETQARLLRDERARPATAPHYEERQSLMLSLGKSEPALLSRNATPPRQAVAMASSIAPAASPAASPAPNGPGMSAADAASVSPQAASACGGGAIPSASARTSSRTTPRNASPEGAPRTGTRVGGAGSLGLPTLDMEAALPAVLSAAQAAMPHNCRVLVDDVSGGEGSSAAPPPSSEPTERERAFLWRVFQAFDSNGSGSISVLEVRALFDRVALEESLLAKGQQVRRPAAPLLPRRPAAAAPPLCCRAAPLLHRPSAAPPVCCATGPPITRVSEASPRTLPLSTPQECTCAACHVLRLGAAGVLTFAARSAVWVAFLVRRRRPTRQIRWRRSS